MISMLTVMSALVHDADAGASYPMEVGAYSYVGGMPRDRHYYSYGYGTISGALASTDEYQQIGCGSYSGYGYTYGYCWAVDASYNYASCVTDADHDFMDQISMLNDLSYIMFTSEDGYCTSVYVYNSSAYAP